MRKLIWILFVLLFLNSCFDETPYVKNITKNFNLGWYFSPKEQSLYLNNNTNEYGGFTIIPETVFAIGFNESFIIAKQHPNKEKEVCERLFKYDKETGDYILDNPADTIYLSKPDSIYKLNSNWYHTSTGWNPPDSLFPYKKITNYYLIDIRGFKYKEWDFDNIYSFDNEKDFNKKKKELGVTPTLSYTIINKELE